MSLESDIKSLVNSVDLELFEIVTVSEFEETIFRISVVSKEIEEGKRKAVSLDTCAELSQMISPLLDVTPPVSGDYRMEVGTPGIEKNLKNMKQFGLSIGEDVSLLLKDKTKIKAKLIKTQDSKIILEKDGAESSVDFSEVLKAKTYFEW